MQIQYVKGIDLSPHEIQEAQKRYGEAVQKRAGRSLPVLGISSFSVLSNPAKSLCGGVQRHVIQKVPFWAFKGRAALPKLCSLPFCIVQAVATESGRIPSYNLGLGATKCGTPPPALLEALNHKM